MNGTFVLSFLSHYGLSAFCENDELITVSLTKKRILIRWLHGWRWDLLSNCDVQKSLHEPSYLADRRCLSTWSRTWHLRSDDFLMCTIENIHDLRRQKLCSRRRKSVITRDIGSNLLSTLSLVKYRPKELFVYGMRDHGTCITKLEPVPYRF